MPTRRMIDPVIWQSETIAGLTLRQRLLFIGLFSNADDQGRLKGHPSLIRSLVFPYDDIPIDEIEADLQAIEKAGSITIYAVDSKSCIQITGWWNYQSPQWAYPSKMDAPDGWQDRLRYRKGGKVITENWDDSGGFTEEPSEDRYEDEEQQDSALGKGLGKDLPCTDSIGIEIDTTVGGEKSPSDSPKKPQGKPPGSKKMLMGEFLTLTGLKMPRKKTDVGFWWSNIGEIYEIADRDVDVGKALIRQAVQKLREAKLTIGGPESIVKTCRAIDADGGGAKNGLAQITKNSDGSVYV